MQSLKKWLGLVTIALVLSACGEAAQSEKAEEPATEPEQEVEVESDNTKEAEMTVEEILGESIKAMADVNGFTTEMDMTQEMTLPGEEDSLTTQSKITMELTQDPLAMHQVMEMDVPEMGKMATEMYMADNNVYFKDEVEDAWFTYPEDLTQELVDLQDMQMKPEEQLEILKKNSEHLSYEEKDGQYVVTVEGSAASLQEFAQELNSSLSDELTSELDDMMSMADITELDFTLYIDKETFYQTKMDMYMVLELTVEGETLNIESTTHATFDNFDEVEEIKVPEEVVENAQEFSLDFSELEDMNELELNEAELEEQPETEEAN